MSSIYSIKIKIGTSVLDITPYVDMKSIRIQDRDDLSFDRGGFKFKAPSTLGIRGNIPPYSLCEIRFVNSYTEGGVPSFEELPQYFVITSTATLFLTKFIYFHDCTLMSIDSILETFIVGAKTISISNNATDLEAFTKISGLMYDKYGLNLAISGLNGVSLANYSNDYNFPIGTTMFDVLRAFIEKNGLRYTIEPVNTNGLDSNTNIYDLSLTFKAEEHELLRVPTDYIEYAEYSQNSDNYCAYLETEASDVIDRATLTKFRCLTPRSTNNVLVSADEAKLVLPVKVESIEKFEVVSELTYGAGLKFVQNYGNFNSIDHENEFDGTTTIIQSHIVFKGTLQQFIDADFRLMNGIRKSSINTFYNIYAALYDYELTDINGTSLDSDTIYVFCTIISYQSIHGLTISFSADSNNQTKVYINRGVVDFSNKILEESVWNGISVAEQPKYLVYKSGTNIIYNMNGSYRNDFWGNITGAYVGNFLAEAGNITTINLIDSSNNVGVVLGVLGDTDTNPLNHKYNVECYPFTNPKLIDDKLDKTPINESSYKRLGRTYSMGDSNGFAVDFKALTKDLDKQNDILGRNEYVVELNTTNFRLNELYYETPSTKFYRLPKAGDKIAFTNATSTFWYVSSLEHRFTHNHWTTQLNLAQEPTKIADAIGVDYQYNPTVLPLENITDRALFYEITNTTLFNWLEDNATTNNTNNETFVSIKFFGVLSGANVELLKRPAVQMTSDYAILYIEVADNVVFDYAVGAKDSVYPTYPLLPCRYVNSNGGCNDIEIKVECVSEKLSLNQSKILPDSIAISGLTHSAYTVASQHHIYKDQRERLTFTIKINK